MRLSRPLIMSTFVIHALLPLPDGDPRHVIEAFRNAAITAGCLKPQIAVQWRGRGASLEIEITCPDKETPDGP